MARTFSIFQSLLLILILSAVPMLPSGAMAGTPSLKPSEHGVSAVSSAAEWNFTGSLTEGRFGHTATALPDGRVLVTGGLVAGVPLASADIYDPATGTWRATEQMTTARSGHTATLLHNGTVLVAGGLIGTAIATAEVYHPNTGAWETVGSMATARGDHTATLLADGRVLVTGGFNHPYINHASAEIYNPATATWQSTTPMGERRSNHTATLLKDGTVLVAGAYTFENRGSVYTSYTAEVYNPATGDWQRVGDLQDRRGEHRATLLEDGRVLVTGGVMVFGGVGQILATTELYDPATKTWRQGGTLRHARAFHDAVALPVGLVVVAGGRGPDGTLASAEVYDYKRNTWYPIADLKQARGDHTLTFIGPDTILAVGGRDSSTIATGEVYHASNVPILVPHVHIPHLTRP